MHVNRFLLPIFCGVLLASAACGADPDAEKTAAASGPITVAAGDTSCEVSRTTLDAGTHTFELTNSGGKVTEFYVYAAGDRVMGEVENVAPGLRRELRVELPAGTFRHVSSAIFACPPGVTGPGDFWGRALFA